MYKSVHNFYFDDIKELICFRMLWYSGNVQCSMVRRYSTRIDAKNWKPLIHSLFEPK